jgi:hypothetical protein
MTIFQVQITKSSGPVKEAKDSKLCSLGSLLCPSVMPPLNAIMGLTGTSIRNIRPSFSEIKPRYNNEQLLLFLSII